MIANRLAGVDADAVDPAELAKLVEARDRIPRTALDEALGKVAEPGFSAESYLAQEAVSDTAELEPIVARILDANPGQVEAYRGGKEGLLGFFVGQVMKETGGKANARAVSELVREKLTGLRCRVVAGARPRAPAGHSASTRRSSDDAQPPRRNRGPRRGRVVTGAAGAATVANGGFESGDLAGWTVSNLGSGDWFNYTGTLAPLSGTAIAAPLQGTRAATSAQTAPGSHILYQDVALRG